MQVTNPYQGFLNDDSNFTGEIKYAYDSLGRKVKKERQGIGSAKIDKDYYIYEYYYGNGMLLGMKQIDHPERTYWVEKELMDGVSVLHQDALGSITTCKTDS